MVEVCTIATLMLIAIQDMKDRQVWAFLFPLLAIGGAMLFYQSVSLYYFAYSIIFNLGIVTLVILINLMVIKWILKKEHLSQAIGLGDIFFFLALALSFPTLTFVNVFAISLLCSFSLFVVWKYFFSAIKTVPLAGLMGLFVALIYLTHWFGWYPELYSL